MRFAGMEARGSKWAIARELRFREQAPETGSQKEDEKRKRLPVKPGALHTRLRARAAHDRPTVSTPRHHQFLAFLETMAVYAMRANFVLLSVVCGTHAPCVFIADTLPRYSAIATHNFNWIYKIRFLKVTIDEVRILDCGSRKDASRFTRKCLVASFGSMPSCDKTRTGYTLRKNFIYDI